MEIHHYTPTKGANFSIAFQQMCSLVAIGQTQGHEATLSELVLQCLALFPEEKIRGENDLAKIFNAVFGLPTAPHEIKYVVERLVSSGTILILEGGLLALNNDVHEALKQRIAEAYALEEKVRTRWNLELAANSPELDTGAMWSALRNYLAHAFLRHGMQAVALLDSSIELDSLFARSLSDLLNDSVIGLPSESRSEAKNAISSFVAAAGIYPERAKYVAQLADGAFSYFSLSTQPEAAEAFRKNLSPLTLFLDTNFLFGILGLTINPQVAVSNDLIRVIKEHGFPFSLRRHPKTQTELSASIRGYEYDFSKRSWSKSVSRAAIKSRFPFGVELRYHQAYIESGMDVQTFFRPYRHADVLLDDKNILSYTDASKKQDATRIATLLADYTDWLKKRGREKPYQIIDHDMTVLDLVRELRSDASSTLQAGALLITCDYSLYGFDWETSRKAHLLPCTVLPNLFWQILRPFIPSDATFGTAFAQTFAIPEFRIIGSGAAEACSKMINILSSYRDFPEATAARMLSNDVLIEKLSKAQNDETLKSYVEAAIVAENEQLLGENMVLEERNRTENAERKEIASKLDKAVEEIRRKESAFSLEREMRLQAEQAVEQERRRRLGLEGRFKATLSIAGAAMTAIILILAFEIIAYRAPWPWLINHPNSYGLQACIALIIALGAFMAFVPKWRKHLSIPFLLSIVAILIPLLGGPTKSGK